MKMIPNYMDRHHSNAEAKIFKRLESLGDESTYCLHSLGLSHHISKREGELDFVVVGPAGIFVIEVKGGRVSRESGKWKFTDRNGVTTIKTESPFEQARSGMYSLMREIERQTSFSRSICYGYGAAFPDIEFTQESPEWDKSMVYDSRDIETPITDYLSRMARHWRSKSKGTRNLTADEIENIVEFLRGDFEGVRPLNADLAAAEETALQLTKEQYSSLDAMADNDRTLFVGPAGTGKTLLAVEQARRMAAQGISSLFLCYNALLAAFVEQVISSEGLSSHIKVMTVHGFMADTIARAGLAKELKKRRSTENESEFYENTYPELFERSKSALKAFEYLIIDEGQDVLTDKYVHALSSAVRGGFESGKWSIFLDPENQKNLFDRLSQTLFDHLKSLAASYRLTINCRNTKAIVTQVEAVTGFAADSPRNLEGPKVKYKFYENQFEAGITVTEQVKDLISHGAKPKDILILSPKSPSASLAGSGQLRLAAPLAQLNSENVHDRPENLIAYSSIQSSKGLESPIVVLTDLEHLGNDWDKTVTYVGYTRAKALLVVVANQKIRDSLAE